METSEPKKPLGPLFYIIHLGIFGLMAVIFIWSVLHPKPRPVEPTCRDFILAVDSDLPLPEYRLVRIIGPETIRYSLSSYGPGRQCLLKPRSLIRVVSMAEGVVTFEHRIRNPWEQPLDCPNGVRFTETIEEVRKLLERCH